MQSKCLAAIIVCLVLFGIASAQEYSIRANTGLNLRTAPSLNADIADTVFSGTILQVVGEYGRWLKIYRAGYEVWLADWVNYSRVESSTTEQTASQPDSSPPANVDNCCGIDRQCSSDQEWTNGYWAFQNGQCAAPGQSQPATQTQPVAGAPANVDNCCFVNRQCNTDLDWVVGFYAYRDHQCAAPALPQPQTSAAPGGNVPANVDNCCYVDRQCSTDLEWMGGWQAYRNGQCAASAYAQRVASAPATGGNCCSLGWQCYTDVEREQGYWAFQINQCAGLPQTSAVTLTGPVPRIEGSSRFVSHITATLKFMKSVAPAWYNYVITGLDSIVEEPVDYQNVTCYARAYARERKATVQTCFMWRTISGNGPAEFDQAGTAAALGHEACHIHTHEEGKHFATHEDEEAECRKFGTGARVLLNTALATGLDPRRGTSYFDQENAISHLRQFCSEGYRADLFCPTLQRMEGIWANVPYSRFPPGSPDEWWF